MVFHGLQAVEPLARGEYGVREGETRGPVDEETFWATLEHLSPVVRDICEMLWWTGCRPSEILNLGPRDLDRSRDVWVAVLSHHKTARKGKARTLNFGPHSQEILRRYLDRVPRSSRPGPPNV